MIKRWTPLHLELLLHANKTLDPVPNRYLDVVDEYLKDLMESEMIRYAGDTDNSFVTTPRGAVLVDMLCSTPAPVMRWVDPR